MKIEDIISEIKSIEKVDIKGKAYTTVATRVEIFRKHTDLITNYLTL